MSHPSRHHPQRPRIPRHRRLTYLLILLLIASFLLAGLGLYLTERKVNPRCHTYFDALWLNLVFFLNGFEDFGPMTSTGKVISLFMFITGTGVMVSLTGIIASIFVQYRLQEETMPADTKDQIIICNWNAKGDRIVKELHAPQAAPETEIIVITPTEVNELELRSSPLYERVYFVRSDPTLHDVLRKAKVHLARSVILLADTDHPDPDAISVLITLAIRKLCEGTSRPNIVVETINHQKIQHLRDAGADEIICSTDYGLGVLAQCSLHHKLSEVYHHMLTYSDDTNEMYIVEHEHYPTQLFVGKTFSEAETMVNANRDPNNPIILVGVRRGEEIIINPKTNGQGPDSDRFQTFEPTDALIVIAYDPPNMFEMFKALL